MEKTLHEAKMEMLASQKEFLNEYRKNILNVVKGLVDRPKTFERINELSMFDVNEFKNSLFDFDDHSNIFEKIMDEENLSLEEEIYASSSNGAQIDELKAYEFLSEEFTKGTIIIEKLDAMSKMEIALIDAGYNVDAFKSSDDGVIRFKK